MIVPYTIKGVDVIRSKNVLRHNRKAEDKISPIMLGLNPLRILATYRLLRYLLNEGAMSNIMITPLRATPMEAMIPPNTPAILTPTTVAMLIPIGPGVDSEIAIMVMRKRSSNHPVL